MRGEEGKRTMERRKESLGSQWGAPDEPERAELKPDGTRAEGLSSARRALLERWRQGQAGAEVRDHTRVPRRPVGEAPVLSFAQQRLWFLDQLEPANPAYNIPLAVRLAGALVPELLARALGAIVRRHEVLRSRYPAVDGRPTLETDPVSEVGEVPEVAPALLPVVDLEGLPRQGREDLLARLARREAGRPFDLAAGPLFRARLLRLATPRCGEGDHVLLLTFHHIIGDAGSVAILSRELAACYQAGLTGGEASLPELPVQYGDYAWWQRHNLTAESLAEDLDWWRRTLAGGNPVIALPFDRPRPAVQSFRGERLAMSLGPDLSADLRGLIREARTTLFVALLATFQALLGRLSGQGDFNLGSPVTGRDRPELLELIGCFVNTLVLRADLRGSPSFRELLGRTQRAANEAFSHRDLPFERLVEAVGEARDLSRNPLFQVLFALQKVDAPELDLTGLRGRVLALDTGASQLDLTLNLAADPIAIRGWLEFNLGLFDPTTMRRLLAVFGYLLRGAMARPEVPVDSLPLLGTGEIHQLTVEWNDRGARVPAPAAVHRLIARRGEGMADAVALVARSGARGEDEIEETLSHEELARRVRRLAGALRGRGVGVEDVVAVATGRGPALVVSLLGVLEAGAAYLPLDPAYPEERLAGILEDAGVRGLISDGDLRTPVARGFHLRLGRGGEVGDAEVGDAEVGDAREELPSQSLAYVLYTSGSTGRPKGIQIPHRALVNFLASMERRPGLGQGDVLVAVTTLSFDIAALELYLPLLVGARLIIARRREAVDGVALDQLLKRHRATAMQATPVTWKLLLGAGFRRGGFFRALCGGEALPRALAEELASALTPQPPGLNGVPEADERRGGTLWNLYGPTETTVWSTVERVGAGAISIGRPVANTDATLVDPRLRPVPPGVAGELTLGGEGLARGYHRRPGATAECFVPHPWMVGGLSGSRLYRTGDLCRQRPDGRLEYLGRLDFQVKLRGFRIELGEIENALVAHPDVEAAAVIPGCVREGCWQAVTGEPAEGLVACVVPARNAEAGQERLRAFLGESLPDYMVPGVFVFLSELPLTPNRKVDRKALGASLVASSAAALVALPAMPEGTGVVGTAPATPAEELLAGVWGEVLGREALGVEEDFFALGGHSLLAAQVVARISRLLGVELPVGDLFRHPTVRRLARHLEGHPGRGEGPGEAATVDGAAPIARADRGAPLPLSFAQRRLWILEQLDPGNPTYNLPAAVALRGHLDLRAFRAAARGLVRRQEALRTTFRQVGGEPVQVVEEDLPPAFALVDLGALEPEDGRSRAQELARRESRRPFDLVRGPLLRLLLLRLGADSPGSEESGPGSRVSLPGNPFGAWDFGNDPPPVRGAGKLSPGALSGSGWKLPRPEPAIAGGPEPPFDNPHPEAMGSLDLRRMRHHLILTQHHIASDFWSVGILIREFVAGYGGEPLAELPIGYADYAAWQRRWLSAEVLAPQMDYWRRQLAGAPALLELPTDRPRPAVQTYDGEVFYAGLEVPLVRQLSALARRHGGTLFMVLLAAFQAVLARHARAREVLVGVPVANRRRVETEAVVGFFVNTLVLRGVLRGVPGDGREDGLGDDPSFGELVARVREVTLGAFAHGDLPFERLVEELAPERAASHSPLFQVAFALQNAPRGPLVAPGLSLSPLPIHPGTAKFDLTLLLEPQGVAGEGGLGGQLEYNTDLFDATTVRRFWGHLRTLLAGAVEAPERRVADLPLLAPGERHQVVVEVAAPAERFPGEGEREGADDNLYALFAAQVRERPAAVALCFGLEHLSYGELSRRALFLAGRLGALARGLGDAPLVGLYLERSPAQVVGILGVLAAGAAYVPMDPLYPPERLAFMLEDSAAPVLLTQEALRPRLPTATLGRPPKVLVVDAGGRIEGGENEEDPSAEARSEKRGWRGDAPGSWHLVSGEELAYVIYTSGSTGRPKGVGVTHANVRRLLGETQGWFSFGPEEVWTLFHSTAFDFSVWEIWGALAWGGRLVGVPYEISRDPEAFYLLLANEGVTVLNQTPSAFRQLLWAEGRLRAEGQPGAEGRGGTRPLAPRWVIFGGEALELPSLRPWFEREEEPDRTTLVNMYGITETTVHVTFRPLNPAETATEVGSVIGRPIPDLGVHLLDSAGRPVPLGVPGELAVSGAGLARGYLKRPALTAERFVPGPFGWPPGGRLYRSGDLARRRGDGDLEYLGRIDHQVQLRGFRVELGEVESTLALHPAVAAAVVLPGRMKEGQWQLGADGGGVAEQLVAWVIPVAEETETKVEAEGLRAFLRERLPEYMVPTAFVPLAELPLTPHGKVDRRRLPAPGGERSGRDPALGAPRNRAEKILARAWEEVLGQEQVGVADHFFTLGGDSILALQVVARAGEAGLSIRARDLFVHPVLEDLAAVAREVAVAADPPETASDREPPGGEIPLTPIQRWFLGSDPVDPHHNNQAVLLAVDGALDPAALGAALSCLPACHQALRLRFHRDEAGDWHQTLATAGPVPVHRLDLDALSHEDRPRAFAAAAAALQASLDLGEGPLLRVCLFRLRAGTDPGGGEERLLIVAHHLAVDGVSWRILLADLVRAYGQAVRGEAPTLPPPAVSFGQWSRILMRATAAESGLEEAAAWWLEGPWEQAPRLPRDPGSSPQGPGAGEKEGEGWDTVGAARVVHVALDEATTLALLRDAPRALRLKPDDLLLTALVEAFAPWTLCRRLVVDLEGHGRRAPDEEEDPDLSRTVGWLTALYPVCLDLEGISEPGSALKAVKEQLRQVPRGGLPYGLLRYLRPASPGAVALAGRTAAEIAFNYLGQFDTALEAGSGLSLALESPGPVRSPRARRRHLMEIDGVIAAGRLHLAWTFSPARHCRQRIEELAERHLTSLRRLIAHCTSPEAQGFTPSDFPEAQISQSDLDHLLSSFES